MEDATVVVPDDPEPKGRRTLQARAEALREAARKAREDAATEKKRLQQLATDFDRKAAELERTDRVRRSRERSQDERRIGREIVTALAKLVRDGHADVQVVAQRVAESLNAADRRIAENLLGLAALTNASTDAAA